MALERAPPETCRSVRRLTAPDVSRKPRANPLAGAIRPSLGALIALSRRVRFVVCSALDVYTAEALRVESGTKTTKRQPSAQHGIVNRGNVGFVVEYVVELYSPPAQT